ncbi:MAG: THUMP domain-containing protein [Candidatus Thermoplasmatota archaeon]|nr:THUMP domain-containing protein [Candidatus Thermoplasmatota archaeon]
MTLVLVRYGEIGLKSEHVRKQFEDLLIADIKKALSHYGIKHKIKKTWGRIFVEVDDFEQAVKPLKNVFGITSFSPAAETEANLESISRAVADYAKTINKNESFAIRARRTGNHDFTSQNVAARAGQAVVDATHAPVNLKNPDKEIFIEVRDEKAFIFSKKIEGTGGMPYESQGKAIGLVKDEKDMLASWLMMRRGCTVEFVCNKKMKDKIKEKCMWRDVNTHVHEENIYAFAESLAIKKGAKAIITGEESFEKRKLPVFYPLLGFYEVKK